jgi:hypothetical protein
VLDAVGVEHLNLAAVHLNHQLDRHLAVGGQQQLLQLLRVLQLVQGLQGGGSGWGAGCGSSCCSA